MCPCSGDKRQALGHHAAVLTCQAVAKDVLKELQAWKQMRFSEWNTMTLDKLGTIKMDQSGKLMDMDSHDGRIKLHYNEDLVVLLREVRLFCEPFLCGGSPQDVGYVADQCAPATPYQLSVGQRQREEQKSLVDSHRLMARLSSHVTTKQWH